MLHIIDDEEVIRDALSWLAASRQIKHCCYESAEKFLTQFNLNSHASTTDGSPGLKQFSSLIRLPAKVIVCYSISECRGFRASLCLTV